MDSKIFFVYNISIRSTLNTILEASYNSGALFGYTVINFFDYRQQPKILILGPIIFFLLFCQVPESPTDLLMKKKTKVT